MCTNLPLCLHRLCHRMWFPDKETRWANQSSSGTRGQLVCTNLLCCLHGLCHRMSLFADKEKDGKINQVQATKRSVSVHKLTVCIDCATGCGLQTRKEMGKSIKFRQQSRSVSVYKLTDCMLCHRMWFADKEKDGKINQVQATKRSVSVYKLTDCIDCATGCGLQTRKEMENQSSSGNKEVSECVQTYPLSAWIVPQDVVCRQGNNMGKSIKFRQQRVSLCTNLPLCCMNCATGCGLQTRKQHGKINQVQATKGQFVYKLTLHLCHRM